jgi:hypothetical protein
MRALTGTARVVSSVRNDSLHKTKWPFMFVTDAYGFGTGWVMLHAPIQSPSRKSLFADYRRRGLGFIGMTSFMTFPAGHASSELDYTAVCQGWAHCFREPDRYLPHHQPRLLLSLSDFVDPARVTPFRYPRTTMANDQYDFVYVCSDEPWKMTAKNWKLAKRCLPILCGELGLRGLMVGVNPRQWPTIPGLRVSPWLPYERFLQLLSGCRFLFVPNELDASPRVMAEALCLDIPLVTNQALIGGWKYVTSATGVFFNDEHDVAEAVQQCLTATYCPRSWYLSQFGPRRAGRYLSKLVRQIEPGFTATSPLRLGYDLKSSNNGAD